MPQGPHPSSQLSGSQKNPEREQRARATRQRARAPVCSVSALEGEGHGPPSSIIAVRTGQIRRLKRSLIAPAGGERESSRNR
jgi:hypothetical protein